MLTRTRTAHAPHALATRSHCTRSNTPSNRLHFTHPPSFSGPGACFRGLSPSTLDAPTQSQARPSISSWPRSVSVGICSLFLSFSALSLVVSSFPSVTYVTHHLPLSHPCRRPSSLAAQVFLRTCPVLYCPVLYLGTVPYCIIQYSRSVGRYRLASPSDTRLHRLKGAAHRRRPLQCLVRT
ncbi:hypothetical protein BGZ61DRAFT_457825 [Ilyonectria robusta]|uniref:uncharacterized protein n=1 Tax=Ilyonectria robusta TaxID=1079257 RepID=UPI001E8CE12F|nr:uncharacterized protein BGZ61DRAFT_457825 [Ilyonectria robusta]KAH8677212.1 hypothetical protein BGZ61DRAFT_457825 [Ilyonectria robusta]